MAAREQKERKNRVGKTGQRGVCQGNKLGRIRGPHSLATHSPDNSGLPCSCVPGISRLINVPIFPRISAFFRVTGRQGLPCAVAIAAAADGRIAGSEEHRAGRPMRPARGRFHPRKIQVNPSGFKWLQVDQPILKHFILWKIAPPYIRLWSFLAIHPSAFRLQP